MYVEVILPLPLRQLFTYKVPADNTMKISEGMRVVVPFGKSKIYTGIIYAILQETPYFDTKEIITILDDEPIVTDLHLKFWSWVANYYLCSLGEVYRTALPSGMKPEGETLIHLNYLEYSENLNDREQQIIDALSADNEISIAKLRSKFDFKTITAINQLQKKNIISFKQKLKENYKPKLELYLKLADDIAENGLNEHQQKLLSKAPKQRQAIEYMLQNMESENFFISENNYYTKRSSFLEKSGVSASVLKQVLQKGLIEEYEQEIDRLKFEFQENEAPNELSQAQAKALDEVRQNFQSKTTVLLHGQTASGKTEIYIHLAKEYMAQGKQVLYLMPEIALTTQITQRLKKHFGDKLGVFHSKYSNAERTEIWRHISPSGASSRYQIILGVRSAIFLPFSNLGLIIVDEEHEASYKQFQPAPKYNAVNLAAVLALMHQAKLLLGSATPSIESYFNAKTNKYALVELSQRYKGISLPEIIIADIKEAKRKKQLKENFTPQLYKAIEQSLEQNKQIILFQNRRGYAPFLICNKCYWIPRCKYCDVSLVYHKNSDKLVCHYCSYTEDYPQVCNSCKQPDVSPYGYGTEQIEYSVNKLFPQAKVLRMDLDTTSGKHAYKNIISEFERHEADILIGTQMVSKGFDFKNVNLVGVMQADLALNYPDFRANERAFQLLTQLSGRSGRHGKKGKVIIQTVNIDHPIIQSVADNDYQTVFKEQVAERKLFKYPPFYRIIVITVKFRNNKVVDKASSLLVDMLRKYFKENILGPEYPPVPKIKNQYMKNILVKINRKQALHKAKYIIAKHANMITSKQEFRYVQILYDVDPA